MSPNPLDATLDASAIGLSGLCLAHCLLLPAAAALLPALAIAAEAEWLHLAFAASALPIAGLALACAHRCRPLPPALWALAAAGLCGLAAGAVGWPAHALETPLTVAGSLALAAAHLWNWRLRPHARCAG
ncbi:MerC family mercury resistance protein [Luteimonas sp. M1R5S18]|uniref:MerC family mercury resistance protein n=1 Tax=Luteimonas rhizosphaericola TaxID=3042024 RepID=A0ABT6JJE4_9GAMM|nr:MerC family mercury resistance protein [Luteimonas rhizosphaericola]MDH5830793.1 MerC family mercury resistance protein [Luteimonas rhizosphaericola]